MGRALEASRKQDGRAKLPDAAREGDRRCRPQAGSRQRDGHAQHPAHGPGSQGPGDIEKHRVDGFERRDCPAQVEGTGDEKNGEDDRGPGEGQVDPERAHGGSEQPETAESDQQRQAGHGRRHHERHLDERDQRAAAGEAPARDHVRKWGAERDHEREGDGIGLNRHEDRVSRDLRAESIDEPADRLVRDEADDRQRQEGADDDGHR